MPPRAGPARSLVTFPDSVRGERPPAWLCQHLHDPMDETGILISYAAFIVSGVFATIAQARFFKALERYRPGVAAPDDEVIEQLSAEPSASIAIMGHATRRRLSALARRWPDRDVERRRMWALVSIALAIALFAWIIVRSFG